jgi:hypothetical protein
MKRLRGVTVRRGKGARPHANNVRLNENGFDQERAFEFIQSGFDLTALSRRRHSGRMLLDFVNRRLQFLKFLLAPDTISLALH